MCAKHRQKILEDMTNLLNAKQPVICISTQLIEAGVNISFKAVIRSAAGLQNIIQAAGRCNRNAEDPFGYVYIVKLSDDLEDLSRLTDILDAQNAFYSVLVNSNGMELDSQEAMDMYYKYYFYKNSQNMSYRYNEYDTNLVNLLSVNSIMANNSIRSGELSPILKQAFRTAGDFFQVIEEKDMVDLLVEYDDKSAELIAQLNASIDRKNLETLLPQLQPYTVSISKTMFRNLGDAVYCAANGGVLILQKQYYDKEIGVTEFASQMDFYDIGASNKKEELNGL